MVQDTKQNSLYTCNFKIVNLAPITGNMRGQTMKKLFNKKNRIRVGFLLLFIITIYLACSVLCIKSAHGIDQQAGLYWQGQNSIDVMMLGTSHIHCDVNTAFLWEKYGIAAYDYSGAEQPLWMTYFYLRELYKYQQPEAVVLDLYAPARFKEDYQYKWISENIYGMRFSLNKLQMLAVSVEPGKLFHYFPSFSVYHNRYDDLEQADFENFFWDWEEKESFKGYTPYWGIWSQATPEIPDVGAGGLTKKSEKYLRKIIAYTKKQGTDLILIVSPYVITEEDKRTYNQIEAIALQEGITFIDYNEYYEEIGLDFQRDFNDASHLNYWGSCKFTDYLGGLLAGYERIPDRRGQEGYESWDKHVELIGEQLESYENGTM